MKARTFHNQDNAKSSLGQYQAAISDLETALTLKANLNRIQISEIYTQLGILYHK